MHRIMHIAMKVIQYKNTSILQKILKFRSSYQHEIQLSHHFRMGLYELYLLVGFFQPNSSL